MEPVVFLFFLFKLPCRKTDRNSLFKFSASNLCFLNQLVIFSRIEWGFGSLERSKVAHLRRFYQSVNSTTDAYPSFFSSLFHSHCQGNIWRENTDYMICLCYLFAHTILNVPLDVLRLTPILHILWVTSFEHFRAEYIIQTNIPPRPGRSFSSFPWTDFSWR